MNSQAGKRIFILLSAIVMMNRGIDFEKIDCEVSNEKKDLQNGKSNTNISSPLVTKPSLEKMSDAKNESKDTVGEPLKSTDHPKVENNENKPSPTVTKQLKTNNGIVDDPKNETENVKDQKLKQSVDKLDNKPDDAKNKTEELKDRDIKSSTDSANPKSDDPNNETQKLKDIKSSMDKADDKISNQTPTTMTNRRIDDSLKTLLKTTSFNLEHVPKFATFVEQVKFKLWILLLYNDEHLIEGLWLHDKPLKVIVHGWLNTDENELGVFAIKRVYIEKINEYNVITVDWGDISNRYNYFSAADSIKYVGIVIGHVLIHLTRLKLVSPDMIHVIGHSLGAHVAGSAGCTYHQGMGTLISRITALDPPYPKFSESWVFWNTNERLDQGDAAFVDVIKTTNGTIGLTIPIGHAEYLPNDGSSYQPGCYSMLNPFSSWICSHGRAYEYYTESVKDCNVFESVQCTSFVEFISGLCKDLKKSFMGHCADTSAYGDFYLTTNDRKPFSTSLPAW